MVLRIIIDILMAIGLFFALAGVKGIIKMPDTFCRMQASTCIPTMGMICVAVAGILYAACIKHSGADAVKIGVIALMVILTNPIGAHTIAKGAYKSGIRPEEPLNPDDYGRDSE